MVQANSGSKPAKAFETYKKKQTLGVGSFGTAYLVECQSNGSLAVIKQIDIAQMSEEERRETLNEAKILEVLSHPNIVRFREVYKTKKGKLCLRVTDCTEKNKNLYSKNSNRGLCNLVRVIWIYAQKMQIVRELN